MTTCLHEDLFWRSEHGIVKRRGKRRCATAWERDRRGCCLLSPVGGPLSSQEGIFTSLPPSQKMKSSQLTKIENYIENAYFFIYIFGMTNLHWLTLSKNVLPSIKMVIDFFWSKDAYFVYLGCRLYVSICISFFISIYSNPPV